MNSFDDLFRKEESRRKSKANTVSVHTDVYIDIVAEANRLNMPIQKFVTHCFFLYRSEKEKRRLGNGALSE